MTPTLSILTLAAISAFAGATLLLWIVGSAFSESLGQGLLALVVPGYVVYYGWTRFSHARRRTIVATALAAFLGAGAAWGISLELAPHQNMAEAAAARTMWGASQAEEPSPS